ncbi:hypothetical protein BCCH1_81560 (plasmid) [Burkholderia contaminans]|uniref:Uncharacterized protein n=1 Tax=Burkholderia contaminans TaxID=488447 RepID=A0A286T8F6_9BURK|nr:hypothetical protein BCCH1_76210 [Burkholderia contaminans]BBA45645.1 hypothetical protein BCCH1_81560 [Burkholderia contaminans]
MYEGRRTAMAGAPRALELRNDEVRCSAVKHTCLKGAAAALYGHTNTTGDAPLL